MPHPAVYPRRLLYLEAFVDRVVLDVVVGSPAGAVATLRVPVDRTQAAVLAAHAFRLAGLLEKQAGDGPRAGDGAPGRAGQSR